MAIPGLIGPTLGGWLLQVALDYSPLQAGLMMLPVAVAGMSVKRIATPLMVGLSMASFALMWPSQPLWLRMAQLALFGAVNSLQFMAMNTVTLKDLSQGMASSGNSLLSMVQMLAIGMGVAAAGAVLAAFSEFSAPGPAPAGARRCPPSTPLLPAWR